MQKLGTKRCSRVGALALIALGLSAGVGGAQVNRAHAATPQPASVQDAQVTRSLVVSETSTIRLVDEFVQRTTTWSDVDVLIWVPDPKRRGLRSLDSHVIHWEAGHSEGRELSGGWRAGALLRPLRDGRRLGFLYPPCELMALEPGGSQQPLMQPLPMHTMREPYGVYADPRVIDWWEGADGPLVLLVAYKPETRGWLSDRGVDQEGFTLASVDPETGAPRVLFRDGWLKGTPEAAAFGHQTQTLWVLVREDRKRDPERVLYALDLTGTPRSSRQLEARFCPTTALRLSPDEQQLLVITVPPGGGYGSQQSVILETGNGASRPGPAGLDAVGWSPDGRELACWRGGELLLWDVTSAEEQRLAIRQTTTPPREISIAVDDIPWAPQGRRVATQLKGERGFALDLDRGEAWLADEPGRILWWPRDR